MPSLRKSKPLSDLGGFTTPRPIGLSVNRNLVSLHPNAGQPPADNAPPEVSDEEETNVQDSSHSVDDEVAVVPSTQTALIDQKRKSDPKRAKKGTREDVRASAHGEAPCRAKDDTDPFGQGGLHSSGLVGSQRKKNRRPIATYKTTPGTKPNMPTTNIFKSEPNDMNVIGERAQSNIPKSQVRRPEFKRPGGKRQGSSFSVSHKIQC